LPLHGLCWTFEGPGLSISPSIQVYIFSGWFIYPARCSTQKRVHRSLWQRADHYLLISATRANSIFHIESMRTEEKSVECFGPFVQRRLRRLPYRLLSLPKMMRLWYSLRLLTLGPDDPFFFDSIFGVIDRTFPALDRDPCEGMISPHLCSKGVKTKRNHKTRWNFQFPFILIPLHPLRNGRPI
jgi:hypothetical protein